ncbi:MAG TPA: cation:proton antiporter [Candidatus Binataceae bacterium]|nr:cation:proton antiporter [Candidatus Binataceae bacterium]
MTHDLPLIFTLAVCMTFALFGGLVAVRIGLPPIVGYLLAGIIVGPFTPGIVADTKLASQLADVGVMLMMFGVGMHFSFDDLKAVRNVALPGAISQIVVATALTMGVAHLWGWDFRASLTLGFALSIASTVVLIRQMEDMDLLESPDGRIAVGWLIVEDLVTVIVLVLLPSFAPPADPGSPGHAVELVGANLFITVGLTFAKVALFVVVMAVAGRRVLPWLLTRVVRTKSKELFTLAVIAIAVGVAFGSAELFGVTFALGAFFAGLVINESDHSGRAATELKPLQDVFTVLFFVSVGMLFDPDVLGTSPVEIVSIVAIILIAKPLVAFLLVIGIGRPAHTALRVAAGLAQIGEFSFILGELGVAMGILPREGQSLIVVGALISITLNPFAFRAAAALEKRNALRAKIE